MVAVALAGPGMNFALAAVAAIAIGVTFGQMEAPPQGVAGFVLANLVNFLLINIFLAVFNLLPIPPFDGSHIVEGLMPRKYVHYYEKLRPFGLVLFFGLVALTWFAPEAGVLEKTIGPPVNWALERYFALAEAVAR